MVSDSYLSLENLHKKSQISGIILEGQILSSLERGNYYEFIRNLPAPVPGW